MAKLNTPKNASTDPDQRRRDSWPETSDEVREIFLEYGERAKFPKGHAFSEVGDEAHQFVFVIEGEIDVLDRLEDHVVGRVSAGHFVGELGLLTGQHTFLAAVAKTEVEVITLTRDQLLELIHSVPEVAQLVIGAFAARREMLIANEEGGLRIVGSLADPTTARLVEFTSRNGIPYKFIDREETKDIADLKQSCAIPDQGTAVITSRGKILANPQPCDLAHLLGLDLTLKSDEVFDVAIVGAGPAGLAAAVYAASEGLNTVVIEDTAVGGQAGTSSRIENYLGFPFGISGGDLAFRAQVQAIKFGAQIVSPRRAIALERDGDNWCVRLEQDQSVRARSIVLACGVQWRKLDLPGRKEFEGSGIYYSATELEARYCKQTNAIIVGGGNSAGQAAMYMSRYATCTYVAVRGEGLADTMSAYLTDRILHDKRIELLTHTEVVGLEGDGRLERVVLRNIETKEEQTIECQALFSMIGAQPNTAWLRDTLTLDKQGYIMTGYEVEAHGMTTSQAGVFAVGDIRSGSVKRVASAVGEGSVVVSAVHQYLAELDTTQAAEPKGVMAIAD